MPLLTIHGRSLRLHKKNQKRSLYLTPIDRFGLMGFNLTDKP
ncbi:MAG: hypothetical protein ACOYME_07730 [Prochlorotrichaceae cyanobacterium]